MFFSFAPIINNHSKHTGPLHLEALLNYRIAWLLTKFPEMICPTPLEKCVNCIIIDFKSIQSEKKETIQKDKLRPVLQRN